MTHILVPTDFSEGSTLAFSYAKEELTLRGGGKISFVTVLEDVVPATVQFEFGLTFLDPSTLMNEAGEKAKERLLELAKEHFSGVDVTPTVIRGSGSSSSEIVDYAKANAVDLIVMSTHGRSGLKHLVLGSVAEHVVRAAPCPVLVVPGRSSQ